MYFKVGKWTFLTTLKYSKKLGETDQLLIALLELWNTEKNLSRTIFIFNDNDNYDKANNIAIYGYE